MFTSETCPTCSQELPSPRPRVVFRTSIGRSVTAHCMGVEPATATGPFRIEFILTGTMDSSDTLQFIEAVEASIGLIGQRLGVQGGEIMWSIGPGRAQ